MSRAKEESHLYLAADDLAQAQEDLVRAWANERRWRWAIDTATPERDVTEPLALRREGLVAERRSMAL